MLILGRREQEVITIGDDVKVVIVRIEGDYVKVGIQAPKNVEVHRLEVYERINKLQAKVDDLERQRKPRYERTDDIGDQ